MESIVGCALNHYRNEWEINFPALMRFIKVTGRQVFERELTDAELDQAFRLTLVALFN